MKFLQNGVLNLIFSSLRQREIEVGVRENRNNLMMFQIWFFAIYLYFCFVTVGFLERSAHSAKDALKELLKTRLRRTRLWINIY